MIQLQQNNYIAELLMADFIVVDGEFLLECCEFFGQPQVWYISCVYVTGFTKTVPISTRDEIQFIADY